MNCKTILGRKFCSVLNGMVFVIILVMSESPNFVIRTRSFCSTLQNDYMHMRNSLFPGLVVLSDAWQRTVCAQYRFY